MLVSDHQCIDINAECSYSAQVATASSSTTAIALHQRNTAKAHIVAATAAKSASTPDLLSCTEDAHFLAMFKELYNFYLRRCTKLVRPASVATLFTSTATLLCNPSSVQHLKAKCSDSATASYYNVIKHVYAKLMVKMQAQVLEQRLVTRSGMMHTTANHDHGLNAVMASSTITAADCTWHTSICPVTQQWLY